MNETQTSLRTLWTIMSLSDGEMKNQTELVKYINLLGDKLKNYHTTPIKTDKGTFSHIIKYLSSKKIIEIEMKDVEGTNLKAKYCYLKKDFKMFIRIIKEINESKVHHKRKIFFMNYFTNSEVGKAQLKPQLIHKLLDESTISNLSFTDHETDFIINAVKNSPRALNYTIDSICGGKGWNRPYAKSIYLYKLLTLLNLDIIDNFQINDDQKGIKKIEFKTNIKIKDSSIAKNNIMTDISHDFMDFVLIGDYFSKKSNQEENLKKYIQTYS